VLGGYSFAGDTQATFKSNAKGTLGKISYVAPK